MRIYVSAIAALLAFSTASARNQVSDRTRALHQDVLVFDAHVHVVNRQFYTAATWDSALKTVSSTWLGRVTAASTRCSSVCS